MHRCIISTGSALPPPLVAGHTTSSCHQHVICCFTGSQSVPTAKAAAFSSHRPTMQNPLPLCICLCRLKDLLQSFPKSLCFEVRCAVIKVLRFTRLLLPPVLIACLQHHQKTSCFWHHARMTSTHAGSLQITISAHMQAGITFSAHVHCCMHTGKCTCPGAPAHL